MLVRDESVFVDWQRIKVQENVDEVSGGWRVHLLGPLARTLGKRRAPARVAAQLQRHAQSCTGGSVCWPAGVQAVLPLMPWGSNGPSLVRV